MKRLTILCDLDSMVVSLQAPWYAEYNALTGDDLTIEKVTDWDTTKFVQNPSMIYKVLARPGFFRHLPALPGALAAVKGMVEDGHRVVVASAATKESFGDKAMWIHDYMPFIDPKNVMIGYSKELLKGDVLLDDGPHNIMGYRKAWPKARIATIAYPYNKEARCACNFVAHDYRDTAAAWENLKTWVDEEAHYAGQE